MKINSTRIKGVYTIDINIISDIRGGFARIFCDKEFGIIRKNIKFVQINHSYNLKKGTTRGFHYQKNPAQEAKLVRCIKGNICDIVVDIRKNSPTLLQHIKIYLSDRNNKMIFIPEGCAHGFQSLEDNTELIYHHTSHFNPNLERGLLYNDPLINIDFDLPITTVSDKDKSYALLPYNFLGI